MAGDLQERWHRRLAHSRLKTFVRQSARQRRGPSLPLIGALLGHSNPATTARYAHLFQDPQRAAVERVGAIIGAAAKDAEATVEAFQKGGRHGR